MKRAFIPLILIACIGIAFALLKSKELSPREAYIQHLNTYYSQFNSIDANKTSEIPKFDRPDIAAMQDYLMTFDPQTQTLPKERLLKAYQYAKQMQMAEKNRNLAWTNYPTDMGGRTRAIMFDPNDTDTSKVWAGSVTGGLWYNDNVFDANSQWMPVSDFWNNLSISAITYDPNNPTTFYLGTGESETAIITYRESSGKGIGIWKSENQGLNWNLIPGTDDFVYIADLVIRNESGNSVIYAAVLSGIYQGMQHNSLPSDGLYRSDDDGNTWEQVLPLISDDSLPYTPSDIELTADGRIFVGTQNNLNNKGGAVVLYSDLGTAGSWTVYDDIRQQIVVDPDFPIPGRVILAAAPSDENRIYALIASGFTSSENNFNYFYCNYIIRSDNKGTTWTQKSLPADVSSGSNFATIAWHALVAEVSPANPDELWVGGLDVFKTTDGGNTWLSRLSDWYMMYYGGGDRYVHADIHEITYKPNNSNVLLIGSDGGVFLTENASDNSPVFQERNHHYTTLQFYTCDIAPMENPQMFIGGLQDNGTLYYTGTTLGIDDMIDGGDGAYCFFDNNDASGVLITSVYYNSYTFWYNMGANSNSGGMNSGIFINPADYDDNLNTLYCNAVMFDNSYQDQLLRITGIPESPSEQLINIGTGANTIFSSVKISEHSPSGTTNLFVGTQDGRLFKVLNAQASPSSTEITGLDFPLGNISSIDIGGSDDTLIVTFSNYGVPSIWQTYDGGANWQLKEGNLPDMPVRWVLYHPQHATKAMIATEIGVWYCDNLSESESLWLPINSGMGNVRVDMLRLRAVDNTVIAASHGRGLFTANFDDQLGLNAYFNASETNITEGSTIDFYDMSSGQPTTWHWEFEGGEPSSSNTQNPTDILYPNAGSFDVSLIIESGDESDTLIMENFITVNPENITQIQNNDFIVFPNPSDGLFNFNSSSPLLRINVYNASAKLVLSKNLYQSKSSTIDLRNETAGNYYAIIETSKEQIRKVLVKR